MSEAGTVIYGWHTVEAALKAAEAPLRGVWIDQKRKDVRVQSIVDLSTAQNVTVQRVGRAELDRMSGGLHHQGIVAQWETAPPSHSITDISAVLATVTEPALLLVLDGVQDPHNLGACLRSAAATGVHAVIAPSDRAVGLNATVRKVASGGAEAVPFLTVTNLARTLRTLKEQGVWIVGAVGEATDDLYDVDLKLPTAIVLGAEDSGLRRLTRTECDHLVRIPLQTDRVQSLNVSVAAGVFLFEARRQRLLTATTAVPF